VRVRGPRRGRAPEDSVPSEPMPPTRYRCAACGNRTRFDVTSTRRSRAYHHFSLGGELTVEDSEVLSEVVEQVACRWCGSVSGVEELGPAGTGSGRSPA